MLATRSSQACDAGGFVVPARSVPSQTHQAANSNNNSNQAFQLIVLARYLLGVPKP